MHEELKKLTIKGKRNVANQTGEYNLAVEDTLLGSLVIDDRSEHITPWTLVWPDTKNNLNSLEKSFLEVVDAFSEQINLKGCDLKALKFYIYTTAAWEHFTFREPESYPFRPLKEIDKQDDSLIFYYGTSQQVLDAYYSSLSQASSSDVDEYRFFYNDKINPNFRARITGGSKPFVLEFAGSQINLPQWQGRIGSTDHYPTPGLLRYIINHHQEKSKIENLDLDDAAQKLNETIRRTLWPGRPTHIILERHRKLTTRSSQFDNTPAASEGEVVIHTYREFCSLEEAVEGLEEKPEIYFGLYSRNEWQGIYEIILANHEMDQHILPDQQGDFVFLRSYQVELDDDMWEARTEVSFHSLFEELKKKFETEKEHGRPKIYGLRKI
ncbi:MAG: hypothetical protein AABW49_04250 [Nanoarchaeota archaeon]